MNDWQKRLVVSPTPNDYREAVTLVHDYFRYRASHPQADDSEWLSQPLAHSDHFLIPPADLQALFGDVDAYLRQVRSKGLPFIRRLAPLGELMTLRVQEGDENQTGLLTEILLSMPVDCAARLDRDTFVRFTLHGIYESDYLLLQEDFSPMEEYDAKMDAATDPAFDMGVMFKLIARFEMTDSHRMMLLKFLQEIDSHFQLVKEVLVALEVVCREAYPLVAQRFERKIAQLQKEGLPPSLMALLERMNLALEQVRPDETIQLWLWSIGYNSMSLHISLWHRIHNYMAVGLIFAELEDLEDKTKARDELTATQLKAIADPTRLNIMRQLAIRPQYLQELADNLSFAPPTLSHHMNQLVLAMLAGVRVEGRRSYYSINTEELSSLAAELEKLAQRAKG